MYISGNWQRGIGKIDQYVRIKDELRYHCYFRQVNLLEVENIVKQKFDVIICKNAFIYFEKSTVRKIVKSLENKIFNTGYLITGVSESLSSIGINLRSIGPSVYQYASGRSKSEYIEALNDKPKPTQSSPLRVLVVDDSPSIVKLLTKIFKEDPGFDLVGTAQNGLEAEAFLRTHKVDVMTLDIHMPEMNGVEYLKKNFSPTHPKVIVVSSASREDLQFSKKMMTYGASDFVEKPTLSNFKNVANEIKSKLITSFVNNDKVTNDSVHKDFENSL
ncbi:MAG: response regulator [Bdellovibrionales bacterium]|nr:response regulator [Bdellovibrionales bacterium]NQZ17900.1 response regulator [Bdellovibrionales bacterium]